MPYSPESNDQPELSSDALLALAETATKPAVLFELGAELDRRITTVTEGLRSMVEEGAQPPIDEVRLHASLQLARFSVDQRYGNATGYKRSGCAMGAPVRYKGSW